MAVDIGSRLIPTGSVSGYSTLDQAIQNGLQASKSDV
jgi:hypothetical protein